MILSNEQTFTQFPKKIPLIPTSEEEFNSYITQRFELNEFCGTIKYCGHLKHKKDNDIWIGVEWDDPTRGKHNGTVDGVSYFNCKEKAGSLLKLNKINIGLSILEAVKFKYDFDQSGDETAKFINDQLEKTNYISSGSRKINIELVGKEKAMKTFSNLSQIECIDLSGSRLNSIDNINVYIPNIKELILTKVLFNKWSVFVDILINLPCLKQFNFSENSLYYDDLFEKKVALYNEKKSFSITNLIINKSNLENSDLDKLSFVLNKVTSLFLYGNNISFKNYTYLSADFSNLAELSLEFNNKEVNAINNPINMLLSLKASNLKSLNLNNNNLSLYENLVFNSSPLCNTLDSLFLDGNNICDERILHQLQCLSNLKHLFIIIGNQFFTNSGLEKTMKIIIGRLLNLKILNNNIILKSERKEYEVYFLKKSVQAFFEEKEIKNITSFNEDEFKAYMEVNYPTYQKLKKKYFDPLEDILHNLKIEANEKQATNETQKPLVQTNIASSVLRISLFHNGKLIKKNIPKSTNFITVRLLISKLFKIDDFTMWSTFNGIEQKIEDEGKTLEGYDIETNTIITIKS